jgi:hypothetical protein
MHTEYGWEKLKDRKYVEDAATDGRVILKWILRSKMVGMDWLNVAQDSAKEGCHR